MRIAPSWGNAMRRMSDRGKLSSELAFGAILLLLWALCPARSWASGSRKAAVDPAGPIPENITEDNEDPEAEVLELPQVVDSSAPAVDADPSTAAAAADDSSDTAPSDVGSLDDYESQDADDAVAAATPLGWSPAEISPPPPPTIIVVPVYRMAPMLVPVPLRAPGIPATSPMLAPPLHSGPIIGGWWHRVR